MGQRKEKRGTGASRNSIIIILLSKSSIVLFINRLLLTNFKNYRSEQLVFSERLNCFVGQNGAGKTNLLDAIYYLCMCKSYFNTPDTSIALHEEQVFRVEGHFQKQNTPEHIVAKVRVRKKKEIERNSIAYKKLSEHIGLLPVVMIAPDDTQLAMEGSEARRKFIDNTICQLDAQYLAHLIRYNKLLERRNALLKQFGKSGSFNGELLSTYDSQLLAPAQYIYEKRKGVLSKLSPVFGRLYKQISEDCETVGLTYVSKLEDRNLEDLLAQAREKDRILQRTTVGIHKDDIQFSLDGHAVKRFASQGQLKSFVLSLKLAQYELIRDELEVKPILLLDDIFDKLDVSRVKSLLSLLTQNEFGQIFITDTHVDRVEEILNSYSNDYKTIEIADGKALGS